MNNVFQKIKLIGLLLISTSINVSAADPNEHTIIGQTDKCNVSNAGKLKVYLEYKNTVNFDGEDSINCAAIYVKNQHVSTFVSTANGLRKFDSTDEHSPERIEDVISFSINPKRLYSGEKKVFHGDNTNAYAIIYLIKDEKAHLVLSVRPTEEGKHSFKLALGKERADYDIDSMLTRLLNSLNSSLQEPNHNIVKAIQGKGFMKTHTIDRGDHPWLKKVESSAGYPWIINNNSVENNQIESATKIKETPFLKHVNIKITDQTIAQKMFDVLPVKIEERKDSSNLLPVSMGHNALVKTKAIHSLSSGIDIDANSDIYLSSFEDKGSFSCSEIYELSGTNKVGVFCEAKMLTAAIATGSSITLFTGTNDGEHLAQTFFKNLLAAGATENITMGRDQKPFSSTTRIMTADERADLSCLKTFQSNRGDNDIWLGKMSCGFGFSIKEN